MTDRGLLELAAKAIGLEHIGMWNPLTDDGDALRLAVKLNLLVLISQTELGNGFSEVVYKRIQIFEKFDSDPYAATRRAIVRAAAEIGKGMV